MAADHSAALLRPVLMRRTKCCCILTLHQVPAGPHAADQMRSTAFAPSTSRSKVVLHQNQPSSLMRRSAPAGPHAPQHRVLHQTSRAPPPRCTARCTAPAGPPRRRTKRAVLNAANPNALHCFGASCAALLRCTSITALPRECVPPSLPLAGPRCRSCRSTVREPRQTGVHKKGWPKPSGRAVAPVDAKNRTPAAP